MQSKMSEGAGPGNKDKKRGNNLSCGCRQAHLGKRALRRRESKPTAGSWSTPTCGQGDPDREVIPGGGMEWREERAMRKDSVRSCCPGGGDCQRMLDSQSNAMEAEAITVEGG